MLFANSVSSYASCWILFGSDVDFLTFFSQCACRILGYSLVTLVLCFMRVRLTKGLGWASFFFLDTRSHYITGCSETHYVDPGWPSSHRDPPASFSVLGLKMWASAPSWESFWLHKGLLKVTSSPTHQCLTQAGELSTFLNLSCST